VLQFTVNQRAVRVVLEGRGGCVHRYSRGGGSPIAGADVMPASTSAT
jgi:hypothetical protein